MSQYTSEAGPIQTKKVTEAYRALMSHGKSWKEVSDHGEHCMCSPFSQPREDVVAAHQAIGQAVGWKITRENYKALVESYDKARAVIPLPVKDNRTTPEQRAEREKARLEADAKREQEGRERKLKVDAEIARLKALYPWAKPADKLSPHARAAANIREELHRAYPGIKFSVKSQSYSGGDSVDVYWVMGPTEKEVDVIISKYKDGYFDGMQDMHIHDNSVEHAAVDAVLGSVKHVFGHREYTFDAESTVAAYICDQRGVTCPEKNKWWETTLPCCGYNLSQLVQAALRHTSFPPGAVVTGVTDREGGTALEQYLATFDAPAAPAVPEPVDMSILGQYKRLQDAHPDDLILLKMPEGYSAYGENAKILNEVLGSVLTQSAPMACIGLDELDTSKAAIEAAGYTVTVGEYQTAAPAQGGLPCHVEKHHHTKRGFDFWLVVTDERVDEDTYKAIRSKCEALGGWYSRKWGKCPGGYAFKDETVANQFAASL